MTEFSQFIFSRNLVHPNIFLLKLSRAFSVAWFTQNKFLTELNLTISALHLSFATIFQHLNFVRFCSFSKLKRSYKCSSQWWKPYVDIFSSSRKREANIGDQLKKGSNFQQRERKYANTWGGGGRARGQISLQKHFFCIFCIYNNLFPLRCHF